jgi:hypothetical protein
MSDLIEKYFQEDLTQGEQDALSQMLLDSEDAAFKFSRLAREAYLSFGLPEPESRWEDAPGPGGSSPRTGSILLVLGLGISLFFLAWHFGFFQRFCVPVFLKEIAGVSTENSLSLTSTQDSLPARGLSPVSPANSLKKNNLGARNKRKSVISPISSPPTPQKESGPVNLDLHPSKTFPNLSVVVNQAQAAPLKVSVLNPAGMEARVLYQGVLASGNWIFEWNGLLAGGQKAPAGYYQIQVQSGLFSQQKTVEIQ